MTNLFVTTCLILFAAMGMLSEPEFVQGYPEYHLSDLLTVQENSLLPSSVLPEPKVVKTIKVVITAYSSTPGETDDTPTITAAGTTVRDGIVANNLFPFGTKIRIPDLYGSQIFVIEDRMRWDRSNYQIDIWFASHQEAENFGAKTTYIEVLGS